MSLLGKASLVMTPNAVKESKVYSIIPSNGNGDLTFTRATLASSTLTNDAGLIEIVPYNLLTYSEQFDNASFWVKNASTITTNVINSPNGTLTADKLIATVTNTIHYVSQALSTSFTAIGTISFYARAGEYSCASITKNGSNLYVHFDLTNGNVSTLGTGWGSASCTSVGDGWYRCTATSSTSQSFTTALILVSNVFISNGNTDPTFSGNGTSGIYIWGAQLVQGSLPKDYFFTTDRLNVPRLNYDSAGGCPSLLLEPLRTNLIIQSEDFATGWSVEGLTVATNTINSPSGALNADTITETAVVDVHRIYRTSVITISTGSNYTYSVYVKKDTQRYFRLVISNSSGNTSWVAAQFDLNTATFTSGVGLTNGTFVSASITAVDGSGWYRCTLVGSITATTAYTFIALSNGTAIVNTDIKGCITYSGNVLNKLNLWGAQFELGAYPTSYIPTTTGTVTRNGDGFTRNSIFTNGLITSAGGTWFIELNNNIPLIRDSTGFILLGDVNGLSGNCFAFRGFGGRLIIAKYISSTPTTLFTTLTNTIKVAIKWTGSPTNTADVFVNGVKEVNATVFTSTNMEFLSGNGSDVPKYIKSMYLFPTPLTDTECIAITQ
jgi:hypothetical protein